MLKLILSVSLGIICGSMISVQSAFNTLLGYKIGILGSVAMVIAGNIAAFMLVVPFCRTGIHLGNLNSCEWYLYSVGFMGVIILALTIFVLRSVGAVTGFSIILLGQMLAAVVLDHFGLFSMPQSPISWLRVLGIILIILGAYFTKV